MEEGVDAGVVEKVVEGIIGLKLEIFQGGRRKVTDQQTKVTVIFLSFLKIVQRQKQQVANKVMNGGTGRCRVRIINRMGCEEKCRLGQERSRWYTKALGLFGEKSGTKHH